MKDVMTFTANFEPEHTTRRTRDGRRREVVEYNAKGLRSEMTTPWSDAARYAVAPIIHSRVFQADDLASLNRIKAALTFGRRA